ncbi:MAG: ATP-binding cassette domain-containing protein [Candidatus Methanogranum gryphiswaldense]|nr:MAG: ATP-binding cassette domain-containing protein [Candidatus Methanogranum sp. U3.2.1]
METIFADKLSKRYEDNLAVNSLSLSICPEIYGLLGPNGSGKTTTVNMLTTMMRPTSGNATICGHDIRTEQKSIRECMSYVPQYIAADTKLTGRENVNLYAKLYGLKDKSERRSKVDEALSMMGLLERAEDLTKTYSGGMHRRLEIAQALVHDPEILFLDEPTVGLDVSARRSIWKHIVNLKHNGMTIFVTTHQMEEAERYCDRVGIMKLGNLLREGKPADLTASVKSIISIGAEGPVPESLIEKIQLIKNENGEAIFLSEDSTDMDDILSAYEMEGKRIITSSIRKPTLEDIYLLSIDKGTEDIGSFDRGQFNNMMRRR